MLTLCPHRPHLHARFDLAGLYVPTSDIDLVVLNTKVDVQSGLKALARLLQTRNVATKMQARPWGLGGGTGNFDKE